MICIYKTNLFIIIMAQANSTNYDTCCKCCNKPVCFPNLSTYGEVALTTNTTQVFGARPNGKNDDPCCDICLCFICCPLRFAFTFLWCFGATFNSCITPFSLKNGTDG
jgi:hypothetical protein